jgi:hypothetical protein
MKLNILVILVSLMCSLNVKAQVFQIDLNKQKITSVTFLIANTTLKLIGSEGDSLTITVIGDEPTNLKDSSGIGLRLTTTGHTLAFEKATSKNVTYLVKIPLHISLAIEEIPSHISLSAEKTLNKPQLFEIQDMKGDVNVESWISTIKLINNTGTINVSSLAADIFAILPPDVKQSCSFLSRGRLVDVTIHPKSKITLEAAIIAGSFTTDLKSSTPFEITRSGFFQMVKGLINEEGVMVRVESNQLVLHE